MNIYDKFADEAEQLRLSPTVITHLTFEHTDKLWLQRVLCEQGDR